MANTRKGMVLAPGIFVIWNIPVIELAIAKLLNLPDGYYFAVTTYQYNGCKTKKYKVLIKSRDAPTLRSNPRPKYNAEIIV